MVLANDLINKAREYASNLLETRYTTVDDVGVAVDPMRVTGQVLGGVARGIGQALDEGATYDAEGQLLTASYEVYCVPRADDVPPIEETLDGSAPCKTNPPGAKGCGESGAMGGPPCITNGVMDALAEFGITQLTTPLTPQKVFKAIRSRPLLKRNAGGPGVRRDDGIGWTSTLSRESLDTFSKITGHWAAFITYPAHPF